MAKKSSKAKQTPAATKREPPFRLACVSCDRDDYDCVDRLPQNWSEIQKFQSLAESKEPVKEGDSNRSLFDWHTHTGYCPECQKLNADSAWLRLIARHRSLWNRWIRLA